MAYTQKNFATKAELARALIAGMRVEVYQPNGDLTGRGTPENGIVYLEGPHYPEPHRWYAAATLSNGVIVALEGVSVEKMRLNAARTDAKVLAAIFASDRVTAGGAA